MSIERIETNPVTLSWTKSRYWKMIITDNTIETISVAYKYDRFAIIHTFKRSFLRFNRTKAIILNPDEAQRIADFIREQKTRD